MQKIQAEGEQQAFLPFQEVGSLLMPQPSRVGLDFSLPPIISEETIKLSVTN